MSKSWGMQLIAALLEIDDIGKVQSIDPEKFTEAEKEVYDFIINHAGKYAVLPMKETVEAEVGCTFSPAIEPFDYYATKVDERWLQNNINRMMKDVQTLLQDKKPIDAADLLINSISDLSLMRHGKSIIDFRHVKDMVQAAYQEKQKYHMGKGVHTGWSYLDDMMGGMEPGDLITIIGRPEAGKTLLLLYMARSAWRTQGKVPLIVSPEMKPLKLIQRLSAMEAKKNLTGLQTATYSTKTYKTVLECLETLNGVEYPFYIVDGTDFRTAEDAYLLVRQLHPDCLYYDGAYLMRTKDGKMSKWDRIAQSAESLKTIASRCNIPAVASYQFNKLVMTTKKGKKVMKQSDEIGIDDIYGSDEIGQLSSVVLGMLQQNDVTTLKNREISVLKGRNGEVGKFLIHWDFQFMNFGQVPILPKPTPDDPKFGSKEVLEGEDMTI